MRPVFLFPQAFFALVVDVGEVFHRFGFSYEDRYLSRHLRSRY